MNVLLVGGGNHIGGHIYAALLHAGYHPVIVDTFNLPCLGMITGLRRLLGREIRYEAGDMRDLLWLQGIVHRYKPVCTVYIGQAQHKLGHPLQQAQDLYERIDQLITLMRILDEENCRVIQMVSSSAVYARDQPIPAREDSAQAPGHIDSHDKMLEEELLRGVCQLRPDWTAGILRHFHVVGAHPSGCLGEPVVEADRSLLGRLMDAARGGRSPFRVQWFEGETPDGSAFIDFVHVQDVAEAHVRALETLLEYRESFTVNLGTGRGHSVLELIRMVERTSGRSIPWVFDEDLNDDPPHCVADTELCAQLLSWRAQLPLDIVCADAWRWHMSQPPVYRASA